LILKDLSNYLYAILIDSGSFLAKNLPKNVDAPVPKRPKRPVLGLPPGQSVQPDRTLIANRGSRAPLTPLGSLVSVLALASRAEVSSASGQLNAPDGRLAPAARLARALVDAMLELKKAPLSVRIYIIGN
jgi:hypothetical protein